MKFYLINLNVNKRKKYKEYEVLLGVYILFLIKLLIFLNYIYNIL